jgi:NADPH:quinone reductase-like Zn-dependent oxidoreductase
VVDYTKQDLGALTERFELIMDNHGNAPLPRVKHLLAENGRFLLVIGDLLQTLEAQVRSDVISPNDDGGGPAVRELVALASAGAIRPVIGHTLPFERIVEAHALVDSEHKTGSVVLTLA